MENREVDSRFEYYKAQGIKGPSDQVRQIIRGMLISLCDLHEKNAFHAELKNMENYMIKFVPNYEGKREQSRVDVIFRYKNYGKCHGWAKNYRRRATTWYLGSLDNHFW